jgi:hypothetical protein
VAAVADAYLAAARAFVIEGERESMELRRDQQVVADRIRTAQVDAASVGRDADVSELRAEADRIAARLRELRRCSSIAVALCSGARPSGSTPSASTSSDGWRISMR